MTRELPAPGVAPLEAAGLTVAANDSGEPLDAHGLAAGAAGARALLAMVTDRVDATVIDAAAGLRVVANLGVGYDNVDVECATRRGIMVTNTPDVLTDSTADLTWALILGTARRVIEGDTRTRSGTWPGWNPTELLGMELRGRTLGVLGLGSIGAAVARRANAFGMDVIYHNRQASPAAASLGATYVSFDDLIRRSDVLTLHAPLTPGTRAAIGALELAAMKPSSILVNTARGGLIDEGALIAALRDGSIAGAGLDVFEREPAIPEALRRAPNTMLLPHLGSATTAARGRMVELACANVIAVLRGESPPNPVTSKVTLEASR